MSPATADYRCPEHGTVLEDLMFDHTPPGHINSTACEIPEPDRDAHERCTFNRVWGPVAIGSVKGAGGSPART